MKAHGMHVHQAMQRVQPNAEVLTLLQVVGEKEEAEGTVNVRTRDNVVHGMRPLEAVKQALLEEKATRSLTSMFSAHEDAEAGGSTEQHAQNGASVAAAAQ